MKSRLRGDSGCNLAEKILRTYFRTHDYALVRHHIESYDQFLSQDLPAIIKSENPLTLLEDPIGNTEYYALKAEIFIGGLEGNRIYIGTPTINLRDTEEIRVMYPNEARLRNLNYVSQIEADIVIRLTISRPNPSGGAPTSEILLFDPEKDPASYGYLGKFPLLKMPIMLHSRYCVLYGKPQSFLKEVGECIYDSGGYFIMDGSEKVLITSQEQAFNTLYISPQDSNPQVSIYSSISCLNPETRQVKRISFNWLRLQKTLQVSVPFVRNPIPVFILFRAMGLQADEDIVRAILPDADSAESKILEPLLHESIVEAFPILDTFSAIQYIKVLTKGFSEAHVLNILHNQTFIHVEDRPGARIAFLAECVRRILRVEANIDAPTDRDDIRNQRCLTSGVLTRVLFQEVYKSWKKGAILSIDKQYNYNDTLYRDMNFQNLFHQGTLNEIFKSGALTEGIFKGFKGKWGTGYGEEKTGVIQPLSRLSYLDFMSHCRRVVLDFDTGMKLAGPRRLHPSQFGYFCTSETPGGGSIGITKNLAIMTMISIGTEPASFIKWLFERGRLMSCDEMTPDTIYISVPVFVNSGIVGYTQQPAMLRDVLKAMKWTGCLPVSASVSFSIRDRRVNIFLDEGRPIRPLIHLREGGQIPDMFENTSMNSQNWKDFVMGSLPLTKDRGLFQTGFIDPLSTVVAPAMEDYIKALRPYIGSIEYVDPYEANEAYIAMFPDYIKEESSHLEIHPSTMLGLLTSIIPFPNHNQSPRNQLSCSQSKQGLSVYATNYPNRFDNMVHVLSYGEAPIVRTLYYDYLADGQMPYGQNLMVAIGSFTGYNQDDGIIFNADSFQRGMFRNMTYRSYEIFEEDDMQAKTRTRVGNPARIPGWTSLKAGLDYSKLDERGIIRVGEYVDESTVLVGMYLQTQGGEMRDASLTAQVWTHGRVEKIAVMTNNVGRALIKIRVIQDRVPELGDKFSTRHGQKGTIGMLIRAHDMPRTADGMVPDMIVNPHCMPSRMTMAQLLESLLGKAAPGLGAIGNATAFMNDGNPAHEIGKVLTEQLGMNALGDDLLYDGTTGVMIPSSIFMGNIYIMRLKHMPEDKWNARAEGRKEQRTHQPTGGRGNQGGLRIGEMERDAITGHGIMDFVRESYMKRADAYKTFVCNGCGTIPIYNESKNLYICSMCDGPVKFIGDSATTLEILPSSKRSSTTFSKIEIPYATKLLDQELAFFLNMRFHMLTERDVKHLRGAPLVELTADQQRAALSAKLPERILLDTNVPERLEKKEEIAIRPEDLSALGLDEEDEPVMEVKPKVNSRVLNAAVEAAVNAALTTSTIPGKVNPAVVNAAVNAAISASNAARLEQEEPPKANVPAQQSILGNLQFTSAAPQQLGPSNTNENLGLGEGDYDTFPEDSEVSSGIDMPMRTPLVPQQQQQQQQQSQVNVQTSSQPVLVVPLNMAQQQAPPAEYMGSATPGAPPTFAVDTSARAMNSAGFGTNQQQPQVNRSRSKSRSPGRAPPSSGSQISSNTPSATRVNVIKES
jgi:DNA-directed RNA polymerase II subunit RPB2